MAEDRLILDKDIPDEAARFRLANSADIHEMLNFTLEANLEMFAKQIKEEEEKYVSMIKIPSRKE